VKPATRDAAPGQYRATVQITTVTVLGSTRVKSTITGVMKNNSMGKPSLNPNDIDSATVGDIVRFIKKSHRLSQSIQRQLESHRRWLMDPHWGLSLYGAMQQAPCHFWNLEPGTCYTNNVVKSLNLQEDIWKARSQSPLCEAHAARNRAIWSVPVMEYSTWAWVVIMSGYNIIIIVNLL